MNYLSPLCMHLQGNKLVFRVLISVLLYSSCGKLVFTMRHHKSPVLALALAEDLYLASGAKNGVTLITNIISGEVIHSLKGHSGSVTALTFTEIERYALVTFIISQYNFC